MKKIKMCVVTTIGFTMEMFVLETAKYLRDTNEFDLTLICANDEMICNKIPRNIKYIPINMSRGMNFKSFSAIFEMIKIFKNEKFDIIQYSTPNASFYASIAGKLTNIPNRIYCQWGIIYTSFRGVKKTIFKLIEKLICMFSTVVEPDSFGNLEFSIREKLYDSSKGHVVGMGSACGVDLKKFDISKKNLYRNEIRAKLQISDMDFVIGFIGRLTKDKGVNELLTAFKLLDICNKKLIIIGFEDKISSLNEELFSWAKYQHNIIFINHTSEVEKYLSAMDLFVLPSYREGFGNVVIEAMAMKIPVICTNIPGPTDIIIHNKNGIIVDVKDEIAIIDSIKLLIKDDSLIKKITENGYVEVCDKYSNTYVFEEIRKDRKKIFLNYRKK